MTRSLDVPCTCGTEQCVYTLECAFECEKCKRFVPACFGGFLPEDCAEGDAGEIDPWCDGCRFPNEGKKESKQLTMRGSVDNPDVEPWMKTKT